MTIPRRVTSKDIASAFSGYYIGRVNKKQKEILRAITFEDVVSSKFSHAAEKATVVRCFAMKEMKKHVKWGVTLKELVEIAQQETKKRGNEIKLNTSDAHNTFKTNARWNAIIEDIVGGNYLSKRHLALHSNAVKGPCVPGEYRGKLRVILEGDEVSASRVNMYKDAHKGTRHKRHFNSSITDKSEGRIKLAGDGPSLLRDYFAVKEEWDKWKEGRDKFFKPS